MGEVRKFLGFNLYDIGYRESYFKDMAKKGLFLKRMGTISAVFEEGEPIETEYRIKLLGRYDDEIKSNEEMDEIIGNIEELGWELVYTEQLNHVFKCIDIENYKEPPIDESEYKRFNKETRPSTLWFLLINLVLICFVMCVKWFGLAALLETGTLVIVWAFLVIEVLLVYRAISVLRIKRRYKNKLPIDHHKDWGSVRRKKRASYLAAAFLILLGAFVCFAITLPAKTYRLSEDVNITAPILRLSDIEDEYISSNEGAVKVSSSVLVPFKYELEEQDGELKVIYYELRFESLSAVLRKVYTHYWDELNKCKNIKYNSDEFDYFNAFNGAVYIEDEDRVVYVEYHGDMTTEKLIEAVEQTFGE